MEGVINVNLAASYGHHLAFLYISDKARDLAETMKDVREGFNVLFVWRHANCSIDHRHRQNYECMWCILAAGEDLH
jgi:hypothetical protein